MDATVSAMAMVAMSDGNKQRQKLATDEVGDAQTDHSSERYLTTLEMKI
jgi:hypothetical protein